MAFRNWTVTTGQFNTRHSREISLDITMHKITPAPVFITMLDTRGTRQGNLNSGKKDLKQNSNIGEMLGIISDKIFYQNFSDCCVANFEIVIVNYCFYPSPWAH